MGEQQYLAMANRCLAIADVISDATAAKGLREDAKMYLALASALAVVRSPKIVP